MIYADNAATTRISDLAYGQMIMFLRDQYGNPSSQHSHGVKAKRAIEKARKQIADAIGSKESEIIFTSSGSEANSWVFRNISDTYRNESTHIITTSIEHNSVLKACGIFEQNNAEVTYLPVDSKGLVSIDDVKKSVKSNTKIVSIMLANNEIGTIQPIAKIGRFLKEKGILFHTDAVQAVGHIPVDVSNLQVDFLTASAHKFNGAKGTGFLYKRTGLDLIPLVFGGEQEYGLRAGTENVAGIVAAGFAIEESVNKINYNTKHLNVLTDIIEKEIKINIPSVKIHGNSANRLPGIVNIGFDKVSGEALMNLLDLKGIYVSTSSACNTIKKEPSHVLLALGLNKKQAKSAIRISFGKYNTVAEAKIIVSVVCDAYAKIIENL